MTRLTLVPPCAVDDAPEPLACGLTLSEVWVLNLPCVCGCLADEHTDLDDSCLGCYACDGYQPATSRLCRSCDAARILDPQALAGHCGACDDRGWQ